MVLGAGVVIVGGMYMFLNTDNTPNEDQDAPSQDMIDAGEDADKEHDSPTDDEA